MILKYYSTLGSKKKFNKKTILDGKMEIVLNHLSHSSFELFFFMYA